MSFDTTQNSIVGIGTTIGIAFGFFCFRRMYRRCTSTPPSDTPLPPPQMPQASQYTPVIQNPTPSAPMYYPPQQQYVVYIPQQQGYSSYPQPYPMSIQPPITQPYPRPGPYQV